MPRTLIIRHLGEYRFQVWRPDGKAANEVILTPPETIKVEGRPDSNLALDLRWYLEKFLDYPKPPNTELAARILKTLEEWAEDCFKKLFKDRARDWYKDAYREGLENLSLKIAADDPRILAWPWEALKDPEASTLAHACRIERQLSELHAPLPLPDNLPADCINILLVIARPYGDEDVGYHALSRPLVEMLESSDMPVRVDVLRPPSFAALRGRLKARAGFYHIVHFDGHGGYGDPDQSASTHSPFEYKSHQGLLVFENEQGGEQLVDAAKLTALLTEHRIPVMVLNACQSARLDENAEDPFASVAASLLKAGIRGVVAMAYNLYVSGAQQFVPAFYQRLLESGDVAEATRAGRSEMLQNDQRVCLVGTYKLQDWLVPVLYQQDAQAFPVEQMQAAGKDSGPSLPEEAGELGDYGFIGRQSAIQALERAIQRQKAAGILIHGMAGIGKTTLAKGFLNWLRQTNGFSREGERNRFDRAFWFSFDDIHSAEHIVNQVVEAIFGHEATVHPLKAKLKALTQALRENAVLMVWDNFESASGIEGSEVTPLLDDGNRNLLKQLLHDLRGGKSKVLITSRAPENWLSTTEAYRMPLGGLRGEESWEYCNAVVADLGLHIDRDDEAYAKLMDELGGHPLAMRAVLLRLAENIPPAKLLDELKQHFAGAEGDESTRRIFAALELLNQGLPESFAPVLRLIGLHRRYVDIDYLEQMYQAAFGELDKTLLKQCFGALENGGLLLHLSDGIYTMHPALNGYLTARHAASQWEQSVFVDLMGHYAESLGPKQLHEQNFDFMIHGANFHRALVLATEVGMTRHVIALTQSMAGFARNRRDFAYATTLFSSLAERADEQDDYGIAVVAFHQLGVIALECREIEAAEEWHTKSLAIQEQQGDQDGMGKSYHQMGRIALERRDFVTAAGWYEKSLAIKEKQGDERGAAGTYHQLGIVAYELQQFETAADMYKKSLAITEKEHDEYNAAFTYHQLGMIAQQCGDLSGAVGWCEKALIIAEKMGVEHLAAATYQQMGTIAMLRSEIDAAEVWYVKSLGIDEKQRNEYGAAQTYHQLGVVAQKRRDFESAEQWYKKSLAITEKLGEEDIVARTYGRLGTLAFERNDVLASVDWFFMAGKLFLCIGDVLSFRMVCRDLNKAFERADADTRVLLRQSWDDSGLEEVIAFSDLQKQFADQQDEDKE